MKYTTEQYAESARKHGITPGPWCWSDARTMRHLGAPNSDRGGLGVSAPNCNNKAYKIDAEDASNHDAIQSVPDLLIERDALAEESARLRIAATSALKRIDEFEGQVVCYCKHGSVCERCLLVAALSGTPTTDPRDEEIRKLREALQEGVKLIESFPSVGNALEAIARFRAALKGSA
ncbi:MAG: hypothetical protein JSS51_12665 [Planctomycetes bacterium]|nr:hypothetical protein [Planctomycetota bacterium]